MQKADLQLTGGEYPDHVALDQKMIQINDAHHWLYAAVDPETNKFLHIRLFPAYSLYFTEQFLAELTEKHDVSNSVFLIDEARELESALRKQGFEYRVEIHGKRNAIECII